MKTKAKKRYLFFLFLWLGFDRRAKQFASSRTFGAGGIRLGGRNANGGAWAHLDHDVAAHLDASVVHKDVLGVSAF